MLHKTKYVFFSENTVLDFMSSDFKQRTFKNSHVSNVL